MEKEPDLAWIFPILRRRSLAWKIGSYITIAAVGALTKLFTKCLNKHKCYNGEYLNNLIHQAKRRDRPLITVSNHHSCCDDPGIWGFLDWTNLCNSYRMRWSLAASNICFTKRSHSYFFLLGKCVPVVRGKGVYQEGVDFCIEQLNQGDWVHIFPEGRVNMTKEFIRLKWGVGRMIYEATDIPIVIPIWHIGMDEILPNHPPYIIQMRKKVIFNIGDPIDLTDLISELKASNASSEEARKIITDVIQEELMYLKDKTEILLRAS